jgi:50S ribosomal protein L16 3-hydroxylase
MSGVLHWALLVQGVDVHVPQLGDLLEGLRFIPSWRVDDVMVSLSPPGASVGPHVDSYDVFLLQGMGRKRWQISLQPTTEEDIVPGLDLRILKRFEPDQAWDLEPGDVLYLPPGVAHWGIALDQCLTYSIGFRAPTEREILGGYVEHAAQGVDREARYTDPELVSQDNPGEISRQALAKIRDIICRLPLDEDATDGWFGCFATESRLASAQAAGSLSPRAVKAKAHRIRRSEHSRFAYLRRPEGGLRFFVAGREYPVAPETAPLVQLLAGNRRLPVDDLKRHARGEAACRLLAQLINDGHLYLADDGE